MEKSWKLISLCLGLFSCELCNGLPINLENTVAESHSQLLTGLVAILLTVCSVVLLAGCLCCQRRNGFKEFRDSPVLASASSNLDHGHINPVANGEFTIFTPLSPPHQNNNIFLANQQLIIRTHDDYVYGDVDVSSWFNGKETDFPRIKLKYIKEIGKGWFGRVVEGAAQDVNPEQKWTPVIVRILEATASSRERVVFLHDAAIYRCGAHSNILKLVGRCLDTIPLLLLQEYCPQGDLKRYLRESQPTSDKLLSSEYPLVWCCQLASALKHIHDNRLSHPDLAARNCQLTSNLTLKLGDYGLAVYQYPEDYYQGAPGVPVRWCAPESISYTPTTIQPKKITTEANIWSFAVTMWEIFECGKQPYSSLDDDEVISQVLGTQNVRLTRPTCQVLYTDYIFRLMQLCWTNSESRPGILQINLMLTDILRSYKNITTQSTELPVSSMQDFDNRWDSFKPNSIVKTDNHITDSTEIDLDNSEIVSSKPLSPSLNNLHGSLDNLLVDNSETQMESWLENVATKTGDMSFVRGLSDAIKDLDNAIALDNSISSDFSTKEAKIEFQLGPLKNNINNPEHTEPNNQDDSLTDSMLFVQRTSSGSETEEENWKRKIERGAYTEKVRQKSRSVADLMILTHIDQSDQSETDTPLPSLDYRLNYKNVRYAAGPKQSFENTSLIFGSEGNLLNVQDTFEEELKKLHEERRDSLFFVPENRSQNSSENQQQLSDSYNANSSAKYLDEESSTRILQEFSSPGEIKPANQIFNVFNVTIDKFSPVHLKSTSKLDELIHFKDENVEEYHQVPKLSDIIQGNSKLVNYLTSHAHTFDTLACKSLSEGDSENEAMYDSGVEGDRIESTESLKQAVDGKLKEYPLREENQHINEPSIKLYQVPKLVDLIQDNDELMDYIIAKYETESIAKSLDNFDSLESTPPEILVGEIDKDEPQVNFDLSANQDEVMPNSLTHSSVFASTPFSKKSIQELKTKQDAFSSLNLFNNDPVVLNDDDINTNLYSLETWDNFLGKALDNQNESAENTLFDSFNSEPQSLMFIENAEDNNDEYNGLNKTFSIERNDLTFNLTQKLDSNESNIDVDLGADPNGTWESSNGGWFLHPQTADVTGEITISPTTSSDSYVGFNMDDEIMAAIRNELLNKLPQAQASSNGVSGDEEEWDNVEKNEVFLRYNIYNTPLSPIPEESLIDDDSYPNTPTQQEQSEDENEGSDWSDHPGEPDVLLPQDTESRSAVHPGPLHRHTPSQDSCCSNDTLFNLEELNVNDDRDDQSSPTFKICEHEENVQSIINQQDESNKTDDLKIDQSETVINVSECQTINENIDKNQIIEFLINEREHDCVENVNIENSGDTLLPFIHNKQVAPLPSPEDKPWKQLPAFLLSYDKMMTQNTLLPPSSNNELITPDESSRDHLVVDQKNNVDLLYVNVPENNETLTNYENDYENVDGNNDDIEDCYENVTNLNDIYNEADYVNIVNYENSKNSAEFNHNVDENDVDYVHDFNHQSNLIIGNGDEDDERGIFGILTDIRFSGPSDNQMMTTSFSESNDLNDEQDWDSGSDTRSSSSGEFIWKEGEHEESLKALRAAPQDVLEDIHPMEGIQEETSSESSGSDDEEGESPEFVPSAWDKYATPTKSALRSPEKTLEKSEKKKTKVVWFKKQKYHCVYEYPREPDSPVLHSCDLWKPQPDYSAFADWDLEISESIPVTNENLDDCEFPSQNYYQMKSNNLNLYQLSSLTDFNSSDTGMDDEFFISSSAKPFDMINGLSSQFFPGSWMDLNKENATPDSGVEDITPGSVNENEYLPVQIRQVETLKQLASEAIQKQKKRQTEDVRSNDVLGGLRHTRNKLKLDLPPSPSAFTTNRIFSIEPTIDPVIHREKPTFTTFGKSRFLVQHVDTPPADDEQTMPKNVSFEALPYKPIQKQILKDFNDSKGKVEIVRGEASLLDSADEDSGIESSTLERKLSNTV